MCFLEMSRFELWEENISFCGCGYGEGSVNKSFTCFVAACWRVIAPLDLRACDGCFTLMSWIM